MHLKKIIFFTSKTLLVLSMCLLVFIIAGAFMGYNLVRFLWPAIMMFATMVLLEAAGYTISMIEFLVNRKQKQIHSENQETGGITIFKTEHEWLQEGKIIDKSKAVYPESATRNRIGF